MRGEYWTRCFRVRSEMLESEEGSAAVVESLSQLYDSPVIASTSAWGEEGVP